MGVAVWAFFGGLLKLGEELFQLGIGELQALFAEFEELEGARRVFGKVVYVAVVTLHLAHYIFQFSYGLRVALGQGCFVHLGCFFWGGVIFITFIKFIRFIILARGCLLCGVVDGCYVALLQAYVQGSARRHIGGTAHHAAVHHG